MFGKAKEFTLLPLQARMNQADVAYASEMARAEQSLAMQARRFPGEPDWLTPDDYPGGPAATRLEEGNFRGRAANPGSEILGSGVVGYSAAAGKILDSVTGAPMGLPSQVIPEPQTVTEDAVEDATNRLRGRSTVGYARRRAAPGFSAARDAQMAGAIFGQKIKAFLMGILR